MKRQTVGLGWRAPRGIRAGLLGLAVAALSMANGAYAQGQATTGADDAPDLGTVQVTGSRIKRTDYETAAPIEIISRKDIEQSGKLSMAEVLRGISADGQGTIPLSFTNGFASGSSGISLRGLGVNSTLVLLNGRRMAPYGLADDGSRVFTDLNTIPLDAVERIEVLKDGASALYGSDAVGGVVNIILRKDFQGALLGVQSGMSYRSDGNYNRGYGLFGFGDLGSDGYNAFISVEGFNNEAIGNADRGGYLGTNDLRQFGWYDNRNGARGAGFGYLEGSPDAGGVTPLYSRNSPFGFTGGLGSPNNLTPCAERSAETGACLFDPIDFEYIQPEDKHLNVLTRGTLALGETANLYSELGYFRTKVSAVGTPSSFTFGGTYNPNNPANPLFPTRRPTLPANHPDNNTGGTTAFRYLSVDAGGRNQTLDNTVTRYLVGIEGAFSTWSYDVGALYTKSELVNTNFNFPQFDPLQAALNDPNNPYRINNRAANTQAMYDAIFPALRNEPETSVTLVDGSLSAPLFDLPGGQFQFAVGAEYRNEQADSPPVPGTDTGQVAGLGFSAFNSDRNIYAGYIELVAPVVEQLELSGAVRYDHYSDYGSSTTPKFGINYRPADWISLRSTYSEAFRAPGPTESGNSATLGFTNIAIVTIGDPSVKPETSKQYTAGIVMEPIRGTSLTIDYYNIKRENEIVQADQAAILAGIPQTGQAPNSSRPGAQPNSFVYYDDMGNVTAIAGPYANANETNTSGVDLSVSHRADLGAWGRLSADLSVTHILSFERVLPDGTTFEYAGTHGPFVLSSAGGTPEDRGILSMTWERGPWSLTGNVNYIGPLQMIDHQGETLQEVVPGLFATSTFEAPGFGYEVQPGEPVCGVYSPDGTAPGNCELPSFTTFDLFASWKALAHWELTGSVLNLFNREAPFDPYTYGGINYNPSFHQAGAIGRFYTVGAKYTF